MPLFLSTAPLIIALLGCSQSGQIELPAAPDAPSNVLFILIDDVGIGKVRSYFPNLEGLPEQPTLDRLASEGVRFENAYAQPMCSPTRAEILTGRHSRRHGIGTYMRGGSTFELSVNELTIPELLRDAAPEPWSTAAIGKWHLSSGSSASGLHHPNIQGFHHYSGVQGNLAGGGYFEGTKVVDGEHVPFEGYATTDTIDDAIQWITDAPEPWYAHVATHAVHMPLHRPPEDLHSFDADTTLSDSEQYAAMLEALDAEIGRLLTSLPEGVLERTNVVLMGDNGTYKEVIEPPFLPWRGKGSVYEGGVRVPLLVTGPAVSQPGTVSSALVHSTDWLPTIAEWAGIDRDTLDHSVPEPVDGESLAAVISDPSAETERAILYADKFEPLGRPPYDVDKRTVRDTRWKLTSHFVWGHEFFDLMSSDLDEGEPLPLDTLDAEQQEAYDRLVTELARMEAELVFSGDTGKL